MSGLHAGGLGGFSVLYRQDVGSPSGTGDRVCHLTQGQSSLSDEAKKFKASGNGDPSHNAHGCWRQTQVNAANGSPVRR